VSRRPKNQATPAPALGLKTVLGEPRTYCHAASGMDVDAGRCLALFGMEEKSATPSAGPPRAGEGWLLFGNARRRGGGALTAPGRRLLTEGAQRIYGFGADQIKLDGRWLMLTRSVPGSARASPPGADPAHLGRLASPVTGVVGQPDGQRPVKHGKRSKDSCRVEVGSPAHVFIASYGRNSATKTKRMVSSNSWDLTRQLDDTTSKCFIVEFTGLQPTRGPGRCSQTKQIPRRWCTQWRLWLSVPSSGRGCRCGLLPAELERNASSHESLPPQTLANGALRPLQEYWTTLWRPRQGRRVGRQARILRHQDLNCRKVTRRNVFKFFVHQLQPF